MSVFPEWLYRLTVRDQQVTPLEIFSTILSGTSTASGLVYWDTSSYRVPKGKILLLQNMSIKCTCTNAVFAALTKTPIRFTTFMDNSTADPGIRVADWLGGGGSLSDGTTTYITLDNSNQLSKHENNLNLTIPEDYDLYTRTTMTGVLGATEVAVSTELALTGVLIPRGNFAI